MRFKLASKLTDLWLRFLLSVQLYLVSMSARQCWMVIQSSYVAAPAQMSNEYEPKLFSSGRRQLFKGSVKLW